MVANREVDRVADREVDLLAKMVAVIGLVDGKIQMFRWTGN